MGYVRQELQRKFHKLEHTDKTIPDLYSYNIHVDRDLMDILYIKPRKTRNINTPL
jgi:hypothetical protein